MSFLTFACDLCFLNGAVLTVHPRYSYFVFYPFCVMKILFFRGCKDSGAIGGRNWD